MRVVNMKVTKAKAAKVKTAKVKTAKVAKPPAKGETVFGYRAELAGKIYRGKFYASADPSYAVSTGNYMRFEDGEATQLTASSGFTKYKNLKLGWTALTLADIEQENDDVQSGVLLAMEHAERRMYYSKFAEESQVAYLYSLRKQWHKALGYTAPKPAAK